MALGFEDQPTQTDLQPTSMPQGPDLPTPSRLDFLRDWRVRVGILVTGGLVVAGGVVLASGGEDEPAALQPAAATTTTRPPLTTFPPETATTTPPSSTTTTAPELPELACPTALGCILLGTEEFEPDNLRGLTERGYQVFMVPGASERIAAGDTDQWGAEQWQQYSQITIPNLFTLIGVGASTDDSEKVAALAEDHLPLDPVSSFVDVDYLVHGGINPETGGEYPGWGFSDTIAHIPNFETQLAANRLLVTFNGSQVEVSTTLDLTIQVISKYQFADFYSDEAEISPGVTSNRQITMIYDRATGKLQRYILSADDADEQLVFPGGNYVYEDGRSSQVMPDGP